MHFLFNVFKSLLSCDAFFRPCPIQWILTLKINELNIWVLDFPKAHYEHIHAYIICRFNLIPCLKKIWLEGCWRIQQVLLVLHKFAHHHHHQPNHPAQMFLWKLWMQNQLQVVDVSKIDTFCASQIDLDDPHNIAQIIQGAGFIALAMWLIFANNSKLEVVGWNKGRCLATFGCFIVFAYSQDQSYSYKIKLDVQFYIIYL